MDSDDQLDPAGPHFTYEVENYRCFPTGDPASVVIQSGLTSLVGVNNAGKSALLRSIYELRPFFAQLTDASDRYVAGSAGQSKALLLNAVPDADDIFADTTNDDLRIRLALSAPMHDNPEAVIFTVDRTTKEASALLIHYGESHAANGWVSGVNSGPSLRLPTGAALDMAPYFAAFRVLADSLYLGAARNAINVGQGDTYYDLLVGQRFIDSWNLLKAGPSKQSRSVARRVEKDLEEIFGLPDLDLTASVDGTTLVVSVGTQSYTLQELGSGFAQFVVALAFAATRSPHLLLVDEPELNLHPTLQTEFLGRLGLLAKVGVLFATHQIGLARASSENVYTVRRVTHGRSRIRPMESTASLSDFLRELNFSGYTEVGATATMLVEGPTELRTMQRLLRLYSCDQHVVLLPLGGGQLIKEDAREELRELKRLADTVFAVIDSERSEEGAELDAARSGFAATCAEEGISCCVLTRRATENYFTDAAVIRAKGPEWRALGWYERPKDSPMSWSKRLDNARIAAEMTRADLSGTDLGDFLTEVATAVVTNSRAPESSAP